MSDLLKLLADNRGRAPQIEARIAAQPGDAEATVYIYDSIVRGRASAEMFGGVDAETLAPAIRALPQSTINVRLNSPGGDVFAARAIEAALREHPARVRVYVDGLAASAASVIAMAGDEVAMAPGSMMMLHRSWTMTVGNTEDHARIADLLAKMDGLLADTYATKCGKPKERMAEIMGAETWLTAQEALDLGLADKVEGAAVAAPARAAWNLTAYARAPAPALPAAPEPPPNNCRADHARAVARARLAGIKELRP